MIISKKITNLVTRMCHKMGSKGRKKIMSSSDVLITDYSDMNEVSWRRSSSAADKGHFVVYSTDQTRFVMPLVYLNNSVFRELLNISAQEFNGSPCHQEGPITMPCDAGLMEHVVSLIQRGVAIDFELVCIKDTRVKQLLGN